MGLTVATELLIMVSVWSLSNITLYSEDGHIGSETCYIIIIDGLSK